MKLAWTGRCTLLTTDDSMDALGGPDVKTKGFEGNFGVSSLLSLGSLGYIGVSDGKSFERGRRNRST